MVTGAAVFAASIAPTEEVVLIAATMSDLDALLLVGVELALMRAFVYWVGFRGGSDAGDGFWSAFGRFTVVGYVLALAVSAYLLWSFGRFEATGLPPAMIQTAALGLPASLG
jgi:putative integral membrane protein (TIGR02587 family)